jgi:hypothetical protein
MNPKARLTDLFYYDPSEKKHIELQKGLKEYQFILKAAALAIANLQQGNLEKFDSLVGENACQIRAIKIALIASKDMDHYEILNQKITAALEVIDSLLAPKTINSLMLEDRSFGEMLDKYQIDIALSSEEIFVITAFILAEMKEAKDATNGVLYSITQSEKSVPNKWHIENTQVSSSFKKLLANGLRRVLSEASVNFVKKAAYSLKNIELLKMVTDHTIEHNTWSCTPMFWSCKTLFAYAEENQLPLILHAKFLNKVENGFHVVNEEFLYFKPCDTTKRYVEFTPDAEMYQMPACVIEGVVCELGNQPVQEWKERLLQHSVVDIILAGAADHRQYPNPDQPVNVVDGDYDHYKKLAEKNGFSLNNPTTFFIQHIYSSKIAAVNGQQHFSQIPNFVDCSV